MSKLTLMVGPPGSGKSTYARKMFYTSGATVAYVNQDNDGKEGHMSRFMKAIADGRSVVVDRLNFNEEQRYRYLSVAKDNGYQTQIIVMHEASETCLARAINRQNHPTIKNEDSARSAISMFFAKYERVQDSEADTVTRIWPDGKKRDAIICDLDGTLCDLSHRAHLVHGDRKDWKRFFEQIPYDKVNEPVASILKRFNRDYPIVFCSGRPDDYEKQTDEWLTRNVPYLDAYGLCMRQHGDHRPDFIIKEILLDYEILTRFKPYIILDDRDSVVDMWRKRGYTCLQVAKGDF